MSPSVTVFTLDSVTWLGLDFSRVRGEAVRTCGEAGMPRVPRQLFRALVGHEPGEGVCVSTGE